MTPNVPVTPDPAVTGPITGGQYVAHAPVHLDVVEVSGTNQYNVLPLALVTTAVPLMVVMLSAPPLVLALAGAELAGAELAALLAPAAGAFAADDALLLAELPHADSASATAASPAAPSIFRIRNLLFTVLLVSLGITYQRPV
jgi:hypothetical protein